MRDSRDGIQLKIERADKHLSDFRAAVAEFRNTYPYRFATKRDPKTQEVIYYVSMLQEVPASIPLIAGDVLQNLRTALDYLAYSLVRANKNTPSNQTCFPISDDLPSTPEQKASFARKVNGMRQLSIDAIGALKPYKGGDNVLWRLHRLNNIDKHRLMFTAQAIITSRNAGQHLNHIKSNLPPVWATGLPDFSDYWVGTPDIPFPLKEGDELFRDPAGVEVNQDMQFFSEIAVNEPGISEGEPLILVLSRSLRHVRQIANDFAMQLF